MTSFLLRRCIQTVLVLAGLTLILFTLFKSEAIGPCNAVLLNPTPNAEGAYHACIVANGLDKPLPLQYLRWISTLLHGDFGLNYLGQPVLQAIGDHLPATLLLIGFSFLLQEVIALPLGIVSALWRRGILDRAVTLLSFVGLSIPTFWLSIILILIFAVKLGWVPPGGIVSAASANPVVAAIPAFGTPAYWGYVLAHPWPTLSDFVAHLILPALTLAVTGIAAESRFVRARMIKAVTTDYVRTARAKGLAPRKVVFGHALRNALLPMITNTSLFIPTLFSGAIVIESIFSWPGVGKYFMDALANRDNNTMMVIVLFTGLLTLLSSLAADVLYGVADPRVQYEQPI